MDRKGIISIILAAAVLVFWQVNNTRETQRKLTEKKAAEASEAAKQEAAAAAAPAATGVTPEVPTGAAPAVQTPSVPEERPTFQTPSVEYAFTNLGGGIWRATLKNHKAEQGAVILNKFGAHPIGALSEQPGDQVRLPYTLVPGSTESEVIFERTDERQLAIRKKFSLPQAAGKDYVAGLEVAFTNRSAAPMTVPNHFIYTGTAAPIHQIDQATYTGFAWQRKGAFAFKDANSFSSGGMLGMGRTPSPVYREDAADTAWAGVTNQYFSTIISPVEKKGVGAWAHHLLIKQALVGQSGEPESSAPEKHEGPDASIVEAALVMPGFVLQPGESQAQKFELYTGPREYQRLKSLGRGEEEIMDFGTFKIVSKVLLNSLNWLNSKFGSYAAAIIVLTLVIRSLMWPLQNKGTQSMKRMQALQPMMTELKEKYKDDPARMNTELMKLYKVYGINPLSGCVPMIVQIPIFFGFYSMLGKAVELRNAKFLWVQDLSQADTVGHLFGFPINVLPICMAATMLWQMQLSPKSGDPMQQRVFMFMPVIFVFFCYKYASALALYWTVQNLFMVAQLYLTRNSQTPVLQKIAVPAKKK